MAEKEKIFVSPEEIEREKEELAKLRATLDEVLRRQRYLARMREYWERRLRTYEARFEELRRIGWPRLRAPERREYLRLRDELIPRARERLEFWRTEQDRHFKETIRPLMDKIREAEEELARKVPIPPKLYRIKIRLYNEEVSPETPTGQFQGWFDIDAILDEKTGMPKWLSLIHI